MLGVDKSSSSDSRSRSASLRFFMPLHLQPIRGAGIAQSFDRGVEVAMLLAQPLDLAPHLGALGLAQLLLRHPVRSVGSSRQVVGRRSSKAPRLCLRARQVRKRDDGLRWAPGGPTADSSNSISPVKELIACAAFRALKWARSVSQFRRRSQSGSRLHVPRVAPCGTRAPSSGNGKCDSRREDASGSRRFEIDRIEAKKIIAQG